jgi:dihydrofolate synthase/folylpolyglutamate synthase
MSRILLTYPESVRFLYSLGNESRTAKLGLETVSAVLDRLGNPQRSLRLVHVAGTNGKGSVCAMVESALRAAGIRTGLFTSPHLVQPTERIQVGGKAVSDDLFALSFQRVHDLAVTMIEEGSLPSHPTYFETVTMMALCLFRDLGVQTAVLEVGLGGRLDATNVVNPEVSVITPVDYDHEAFLGKSLESIAGEKAGIMKPGVPVVLGPQRPPVEALLVARAARMRAPLLRYSDWQVCDLELTASGSRFTAMGPERLLVECALAGEHQIANACTAISVLRLLGVSASAIEEGLRKVKWPGRLERVGKHPEIVLDGAHNPAGARALASHLDRFYTGRRLWLVYGAMRDKAVGEVMELLLPKAATVILTAPSHPRALRPDALASLADHPDRRTAPDLPAALNLIRRQAAPEDAVFITGSLFLVGEARALLVQ